MGDYCSAIRDGLQRSLRQFPKPVFAIPVALIAMHSPYRVILDPDTTGLEFLYMSCASL